MKFMQAAKHGGSQDRVDRIVIHATVSPCVRGGALNVARYFQSAKAGGSAHYTTDPAEIVASVRENVVAHHAPPNTGSIGIELCDPQKGPASRWKDAEHEAMLRLAAGLVRQVAARWDVPLRRLTVAEVRAGERGICGHVDVSRAFRQSDHVDPGTAFPWDHFMELVAGTLDGPPPWPGRLLEYPPVMRGRDVTAWQTQMRDVHGMELAVDGAYGPQSHAVCRVFQRLFGLDDDGAVGKQTWDAAFKDSPDQR